MSKRGKKPPHFFRRPQPCSSILAQPNLMISTNSNKRSKIIEICKIALSTTEKKGHFQCRKLVQQKVPPRSFPKHLNSNQTNWMPFANATNAKPTSWQTLAITPPAKQANISNMKPAATCATASPYHLNKISTIISKPKFNRTSAKHG